MDCFNPFHTLHKGTRDLHTLLTIRYQRGLSPPRLQVLAELEEHGSGHVFGLPTKSAWRLPLGRPVSTYDILSHLLACFLVLIIFVPLPPHGYPINVRALPLLLTLSSETV